MIISGASLNTDQCWFHSPAGCLTRMESGYIYHIVGTIVDQKTQDISVILSDCRKNGKRAIVPIGLLNQWDQICLN